MGLWLREDPVQSVIPKVKSLMSGLSRELKRLSWKGAPSDQQSHDRHALDGRAVFAIGDIHGCLDLLDGLLEGIKVATARDAEPPLIIFLGDYVDRGPGSRGVIDRLIAVAESYRGARFLCGNHEEAMVRFLADPAGGPAWSTYGGRATMLSYGVRPPGRNADDAAWARAQQKLNARIPPAHLKFLWGLEDSVEVGDYFFAHAGVRPDKPLQSQASRDLRWIREPFLSNDQPLEKMIVHGHTPSLKPHADRARIGVDTWAYKTGVLTALELRGRRRRYLVARRDGASIRVRRCALRDFEPTPPGPGLPNP
jgi:serine/threonine protein phosphatase 1